MNPWCYSNACPTSSQPARITDKKPRKCRQGLGSEQAYLAILHRGQYSLPIEGVLNSALPHQVLSYNYGIQGA